MPDKVFERIASVRAESIRSSVRSFAQTPKVLHCFVNGPDGRQVDAVCCLGKYSPPRLFDHYAFFADESFVNKSEMAARLKAANVVVEGGIAEITLDSAVQLSLNRNFELYEPFLPSVETRRLYIRKLAVMIAANSPDIVFVWYSQGDGLHEDFLWAAFIAGVPSIVVSFQRLSAEAVVMGQAGLWSFLAKGGHIAICVDSYETAILFSKTLHMPLRDVYVLNDVLIQPEAYVRLGDSRVLKRYLALPDQETRLVAVSCHLSGHSLPQLVNALRKMEASGRVQCFILGDGPPSFPLSALADAGIDVRDIDLPLEAALTIADTCFISAQEIFNANLGIKARLLDCALVFPEACDESGCTDASPSNANCLTRLATRICDNSARSSVLPQYETALLTEVRRDWFVSAFIGLLYRVHERWVLALPPSSHDAFSQVKYALQAARLRDLLFGGFSCLAIDGLRLMLSDLKETRHERMSASWHLIMWYYMQGEYDEAYALIGLCKQLSLYPPELLLQAEVFCLLRLHKYALAADVLEACFRERSVGVDFLVIHATAVRQKLLHQEGDKGRADDEFLNLLGEAFRAMNLAPLEVRDAAQPLSLANIHAPKACAENDCSRMVSVIFPVYNMGHSIGYSLRSIQEQTWRNIEIIVVDDASTDESASIVAAMAKEDERIKLIRLPNNQGTYTAVNVGLQAALGSAIVIHGADDWSHPQKLARQLAYLSQNPSAVAVESRTYRVNMNVDVSCPWRIMPYITIDASTLFTRDAMLALGGWDAARFGADTELAQRARALFGAASVVTMPQGSVFALLLEGTLTTSQKTGLRSWQTVIGARKIYSQAYTVWHQSAKNEHGSLHIADKAFNAPLANRREREAVVRFDVVVLDDFARDDAHLGKGFSLAEKLSCKGLAVALLHWRSPLVDSLRPIAQEIYTRCYSAGMCILCSADTVVTDSLVALSYGLFYGAPDDLPAITIDKAECYTFF